MKIYKKEDLLRIPGVTGKPIDGICIKKLDKMVDERGAVYHMIRKDDVLFEEFGEIYFSKVYPGVIKGWHLHTKMLLNYAVISGMIKLVLYDDRKKSLTRGNLMEIFMGDENYILVKIPSFIWNGVKGIGAKTAIIANCATLPHDPSEIKRLKPFSNKIPYHWDIKHG